MDVETTRRRRTAKMIPLCIAIALIGTLTLSTMVAPSRATALQAPEGAATADSPCADDAGIETVGGEESCPAKRPARNTYRAHVPLLLRGNVGNAPYFDNFNDPASGWPGDDLGPVAYSYQSGEYEILIRNQNFWAGAAAPIAGIDRFALEVDVRPESGSNAAHGLIFGLQDWQHFFFFAVDPNNQQYTLWKATGSGWQRLIDWTSSSVVQQTPASNRLRVERSGDQIDLWINGRQVGHVVDGSYIGWFVGLIMLTTDVTPAASRFENYAVWSLGASPRQEPLQPAGQTGWGNLSD